MFSRFSTYKNNPRNYRYKKSLVFVSLLLPSIFSFSQTNQNDITVPPQQGFRCRAEIVDGDTIPVVDLYTVDIITDFVYKNPRQYELWTRTKYNVKIVYPYAILAAAKLKEYDKVLVKITDPKLKKTYLKLCEKDLRKEFEDELKTLIGKKKLHRPLLFAQHAGHMQNTHAHVHHQHHAPRRAAPPG